MYQSIKGQIIAQGSWLQLKKLFFKTPKGRILSWETIERKQHHSNQQFLKPDSVEIVAFINNRQDIICISQYRPAVGKHVIELPSGLIDAGESIEDAAFRELSEETGYSASRVLYKSPPLCLGMAVSNTMTQCVFVECDNENEPNPELKQHLDECEFIDQVFIIPRTSLLPFLHEKEKQEYIIDGKLFLLAIQWNEI